MNARTDRSDLHVIFGTGPLGRFTAEALLAEGRRVREVRVRETLASARGR